MGTAFDAMFIRLTNKPVGWDGFLPSVLEISRWRQRRGIGKKCGETEQLVFKHDWLLKYLIFEFIADNETVPLL